MNKLFDELKEEFGGHQQGNMCFLTGDDFTVDVMEIEDEFDGVNVGTEEGADVGLYGAQLFFVNKSGIVEYLKDYKHFAEDADIKQLMQDLEEVVVNFVMENQKAASSTSRYCAFYKAKDNNWYLELAPDEYDGYETADTYGPFETEEAAEKYLDYNFSNPGSWRSDNSGKKEVPTKSPNGRPITKPSPSNGRNRRSMWSVASQEIPRDFRKDLQKIEASNTSLSSANILGFNMNSEMVDGREIDTYTIECNYHVLDGIHAANVILGDLVHHHKIGKMLMDLSNSDKIILNGIEVDMDQIQNELSVANVDEDESAILEIATQPNGSVILFKDEIFRGHMNEILEEMRQGQAKVLNYDEIFNKLVK